MDPMYLVALTAPRRLYDETTGRHPARWRRRRDRTRRRLLRPR